jgi:hypothetical protein
MDRSTGIGGQEVMDNRLRRSGSCSMRQDIITKYDIVSFSVADAFVGKGQTSDQCGCREEYENLTDPPAGAEQPAPPMAPRIPPKRPMPNIQLTPLARHCVG